MRILLAFVLSCLLLGIALGTSEYRVINVTEAYARITLQLQYFGKEDYYIKPSSPIIRHLSFTFWCLTSTEFYFRITDSVDHRFQTIKSSPFPIDMHQGFSYPVGGCGGLLTYTKEPFDFKITRLNSQTVLFSTYEQEFIYSNYYIQIGTELASDKLFGLGERFSVNFRKKDAMWTIWNRPGDQIIDYGTGNNTYGFYPFYLLVQPDRYSHIGYLKTTNALDAIKSTKGNKNYLTFKITGGIIDFRFSLGSKDKVMDLISYFQQICIGLPAVPPFWSLGFHQSKWGYDSAQTLNSVLKKYEQLQIPLDTIWSDIDYMDQLNDFTVDEKNFPLKDMADIISRYHYVPIIDAGVGMQTQAYEIGHKRDVFIKDLRGQEFKGLVWPGDTAFVDYFHPNATQYWADMLESLYDKLKFSGIWLDMNQITQFCDGSCTVPSQPAIIDYSKDLPYHPGMHSIQQGTISLNLTHYGNRSEFNVHPYFPLLQTSATYKFLKKKSKFPFILSRSTTFGSSKYGFHWTGDNYASWQFLRSTIVDNMNINLFGINMVGPDICGFGGNTTEKLCARWYQMALVLPFARSHSDYWSISQEPFSLGSLVQNSAILNLRLRYMFLKQFYSWWVLTRGTTPFFTSLAYYPATLSGITNITEYDHIVNTQFTILGQPLMVAPIVEEEKVQREVFFIDYRKIDGQISYGGRWTQIRLGHLYQPGQKATITNQYDDMLPLYMLEGTLLFVQELGKNEPKTKTSQLDNHFQLLAALDLRNQQGDKQVYQGRGSILSINDFSNEENLVQCLRQKCSYDVVLTLKSSGQHVSITVKSYYTSVQFREKMFIDRFLVYFDRNHLKEYTPPEPLQIYERVNKTYTFDMSQLKSKPDVWEQMTGLDKSTGNLKAEKQ